MQFAEYASILRKGLCSLNDFGDIVGYDLHREQLLIQPIDGEMRKIVCFQEHNDDPEDCEACDEREDCIGVSNGCFFLPNSDPAKSPYLVSAARGLRVLDFLAESGVGPKITRFEINAQESSYWSIAACF